MVAVSIELVAVSIELVAVSIELVAVSIELVAVSIGMVAVKSVKARKIKLRGRAKHLKTLKNNIKHDKTKNSI